MVRPAGAEFEEHAGGPRSCDPADVGRLAVLQSAIGAMPTVEAVASLVEAGLLRLPGVAGATVTLRERPAGGTEEEAPAGARRIALETLRGRYGWFDLELTDPVTFEAYEPHVHNLANAVALHLETENQRARLERLIARQSRLNLRLREANARLRRTATRDQFLVITSERLASTPDADAAMAQIAPLVVGHFGGPCVVLRLRNEGGIEAVLVAGRSRGEERTIRELLEHLAPEHEETLEGAVRTGEMQLVRQLVAGELGGETKSAATVLGVRSYVGVPLRNRGEVLGLFGVLGIGRELDEDDRDTAERLSSRLALALENARLFERAREAVSDRERLLAIVSHDLRTPLTAIKLQFDLLGRRLRRGECGDDLVSRLGPMDAAIRQMQGLLGDLLDFSRMQAGSLVLDRRPSDVNELIRTSVEVVRPIAERKGVAVETPGADTAVVASCDPDRVRQLLANLLGNALKFTPPAGHVEVTAVRSGSRVLLTVRDDGPGLAPESLPRIFDPFWQARGADRSGLGLGLAIVRSIAESHGGGVCAESEPGKGTSIRVTLPVA